MLHYFGVYPIFMKTVYAILCSSPALVDLHFDEATVMYLINYSLARVMLKFGNVVMLRVGLLIEMGLSTFCTGHDDGAFEAFRISLHEVAWGNTAKAAASEHHRE